MNDQTTFSEQQYSQEYYALLLRGYHNSVQKKEVEIIALRSRADHFRDRVLELEKENARLTDKLEECNGRGEIPDFKELT